MHIMDIMAHAATTIAAAGKTAFEVYLMPVPYARNGHLYFVQNNQEA
jgi:spore coat polysaccharide biosynthesis predicted glycosyltransferase SpsG